MKVAYFFTLLLLSLLTNAQDLDSLQAELNQTNPDSVVYQINIEIGYSLMYDFPDSAREYFLDALGLARKFNHDQKMASSMTLTGVTYYFNGQFEEAMNYYVQAITISEKTEDKRYTGIISNNIGAVYFEMKAYEKATDYYGKAIELFEVAQDTFWLSNALNNMGNALEKTHRYDEALDIYQQSLELAETSSNEEAIGSAMSNLGNVFMAQGRIEEALQQYQEGIIFQKKAKDKTGEAISYNNIGRLYAKKKAFKKAIKYHLDALAIAEEQGHLETIKNAKKWLAEVYPIIGDYPKAYRVQSEYILLNDSLVGLEKANAVEELNQKYEAEKKERKITELELDQKNAALALSNSNNQRNIFIFGSMLLMVLAGSLYYRFYSKKRTSEILTEKNKQISVALEERETLLKEIHHRVKNNLQVISSLLNLQAGSLEDEAAKEAVREGQHRVKSMALIHQKLYSTDDIRGVETQDYFENLFRELFIAFGVDGEKIDYHVAAQNFKLDIDTLIPLGLIVNELITNAIKYAFEGLEEGKISFEMQESAERLIVTLRDNGNGMDTEMMQQSNAFGWKMIRSLSRKLKAEIAIQNDQGTTVQITIARYKLAV